MTSEIDRLHTLPSESASGQLTAEELLAPYFAASLSDNTRRTYTSALGNFIERGGRLPVSPERLCEDLARLAADLSPSSLDVLLSAIAKWHRLSGFPNPCDSEMVSQVQKGIRRVHGSPPKKAYPIRPDELVTMINLAGTHQNPFIAQRDAALLSTGYFGALRPEEVAKLTRGDIEFTEGKGVVILLSGSKTDQERFGQSIYIPTAPAQNPFCPVRTLQGWYATHPPTSLARSWLPTDALFPSCSRWGKLRLDSMGRVSGMSRQAFDTLAKAYAERVGMLGVSGHSFRRGFATSVIEAGARREDTKKHGRWKTDAAMDEYIEVATGFKQNACHALYASLEKQDTNDG